MKLGIDVLRSAIERLASLYRNNDKVVVSFSAGKDSGVCLELCRIAARQTNSGKVCVIMRDEEIMFPGTYEYAERVANYPDVEFHWIYANQPIINISNRKNPYFWVFDPLVPSDEWVRKPPKIAYKIDKMNINAMVTKDRFKPLHGKSLVSVIGLRVDESPRRRMGLYSSKGFLTAENEHGVKYARPIYDWTVGDVWKFVHDYKLDYNVAYNTLKKYGVTGNKQRIAPPTISLASADHLKYITMAHPAWADRLYNRLLGMKMLVKYGRIAITPSQLLGETYKDTFLRTCVNSDVPWIAERAQEAVRHYQQRHRNHSNEDIHDIVRCARCATASGTYKELSYSCYHGDPFSMAHSFLPYMEPEFFREGAGLWGGKPAF
jgi:predicted phosphoadenosine phosphosulfate sulfurtransferase